MKKFLPGYLILGLTFVALFHQVKGQGAKPIKINAQNAAAYRDSLKNAIFGTIVFPYDILPDSVATNVSIIDYYPGSPYSSIIYPSGNLDSIDRISIFPSPDIADFPQPVQAYLFHPHIDNGKLFIYHSGHCAAAPTAEDVGDNSDGAEPGLVIPTLLAEGYTVLAVPMMNYKLLYRDGLSCGYNNHNALFSDGHYTYPLSLFFKPLIASLNFVGRGNYSDIYMCGLSGGGWTTSVYPAIDSSITCSFPVAGSWPLSISNIFSSDGDLEQYYAPVFRNLLDYHELYTLSCLAPARKMLQINNRYDACCFEGAYAHIYYVDSVVKALQGTQGIFKFYLDETDTGHQISPRAVQVMFRFIQNDTAFLQTRPTDTITNGMNYFYDIGNNFALNSAPDNAALKYSLLKAPYWLSLDTITGKLNGIVPGGNVISRPDSISFKVEDSTGRFVIYNYILHSKRSGPYFFTGPGDSSIVYFLPAYSNSINNINPLVGNSFYFNNPGLTVLGISLVNNSLLKLKLNEPVSSTDSIGYNGFGSPYALTYNSGLKLGNFDLSPVHLNAVINTYAIGGMIRFNSETGKFEYFNGNEWINMN